MEGEIHVVDSGTVTSAGSGSMVVVTDADGKQQILHLSNDEQTSTEMLLEDLPTQLHEESLTIMQQTDGIDYLSHQRAAEVLQSIGEGMVGEGMSGQLEEVNGEQNQAVVYVEGCEDSDAIAAALKQAGATENGDEQSQVIVLEGGSDGLVDMTDVAEGFQGTLIVIMQQDEQQNNAAINTTGTLQESHEDSLFSDPKAKHIDSEQTVSDFDPAQVFTQVDESFKENIECKDVSQEPILEKPYHCKECDKRFAWKRSLMVHERIHSGKDMFTCEQCGKSYSSKVSLNSHIATHTRQEDKPFSCDICGKRFTKKWDWQTHKWQHTGQKKYICEHCGKTYARNSDLRRHVLSHTGNKPFQCKYCGKRFITRWHYNYHERRHTGEKPYQCQLCWKEFMQKCHLDRHEITHASETYSCQYCGRKYIHKDEVLRHERTHIKQQKDVGVCQSESITVENIETNAEDMVGSVDDALEYLMAFASGQSGIDLKEIVEPKVKCTSCNQYFKDNNELLIHKEIQPNCGVNIASSTDSIKCKYCDRIFKYKTSFIKHVSSHAAFHFDDEFEDLRHEIEERTQQASPESNPIFVCVCCFRGYSEVASLKEHKKKCKECLEKTTNETDELNNDTNKSKQVDLKDNVNDSVALSKINEPMVSPHHLNAIAGSSQLNATLSDNSHQLDDAPSDSLKKLDATPSDSLNQIDATSSDSHNQRDAIPSDGLNQLDATPCDSLNQSEATTPSDSPHNFIQDAHDTDNSHCNETNKNDPAQVKLILAQDDEGQQVQVPLVHLTYVCRFCNCEFKYRTSFERHEEQHEGAKATLSKSRRPYVCTLCGIGFRRSFHLIRHMETHSRKVKPKPQNKLELKPVIETVKGEEIQEITDIVRDETVLNISEEFENSSNNAHENNKESETKKEQINKMELTLDQNQIEDTNSEHTKRKISPDISKTVDLSIPIKTRCQRLIRLPKRFRTDAAEKTPEEDVEEVITLSECHVKEITKKPTFGSPAKRGRPKKLDKETFHKNDSNIEDDTKEENQVQARQSDKEIKQTLVASARKRGRPKKVITETFNCKKCKKSFPFKSLLRNHNITKHKIWDESKDIDSTSTVNQTDNLNLENSDSKCTLGNSTELSFPNTDVCTESSVDSKCSTLTDDPTKMINTHPQDSHPVEQIMETLTAKYAIETDTKGIHTRSKSSEYLCDECGRKLPSQIHLLSHKKIHIKKDPKKENCQTSNKKEDRCDKCQRVFKTNTLLKRHQLTHMDKKNFKCSTCGKSFNRSDDLKRHNTIHAGKTSREKPFSCEVCGKTFSYKFPLKVHLQSHTGDKPHMCDICGKMFAKKFDMEAHRNMHSGNTPHVCKICQKKYGRKSDLDRHMTKHTGTQPLSCSFCDRKFATRWHLNYHERTHTGEKPYACEVCGKRFLQLPHLTKHSLLHKKNKESTSAPTNIDKVFDDNALLNSVVQGLQQASEGSGSLQTLQDDSQQIIQVLQVEGSNPDEMEVFSLIIP